MKSSFFIIADRGNLKAYRAEKTAADRGPRMQLVRAMNFAEAQSRMREINEDADGAFPVGAGPANGSGGGNGRHQNSAAEKHHDLELDRRAVKQLAETINELLQEQHPDAWSFAAPAEIKEAVLQHVSPDQRKKLAESLPLNLVHVKDADLLGHFSEVRAA